MRVHTPGESPGEIGCSETGSKKQAAARTCLLCLVETAGSSVAKRIGRNGQSGQEVRSPPLPLRALAVTPHSSSSAQLSVIARNFLLHSDTACLLGHARWLQAELSASKRGMRVGHVASFSFPVEPTRKRIPVNTTRGSLARATKPRLSSRHP